MHNRSKRIFVRRVAGWLALAGITKAAYGVDNGPISSRADAMKSALDKDALDVERLYSEKPIVLRVGAQQYRLPRNYLTPKGAAEPDVVTYKYLAFYLFLPNYGGYTKENWREGQFHDQLIDVMEVRRVDKNAVARTTKGEKAPVNPASYGEPRAAFKNRQRLLEATPSMHMFGLDGYRAKNHRSVKEVHWVGTRPNGEFFFFRSSSAPGEDLPPGVLYPSCVVRYYSEKEDLYIMYRYRQKHIEQWREIDAAIWQKIKEWRNN